MSNKRVLKGVYAWLFGLATTVFLISMWGRAVVIDVDTLQASATPLTESSAIVDIFTGWLDRELVDTGVEQAVADAVVEDVLDRSSVIAALGEFTGEVVVAASAPGPEPATVDVSGLLRPAVPEIGAVLNVAGVPITESRLTQVVDGIDPLVVKAEGAEPYIGPSSPTAGRLGTAAVLALAVMAATGWLSIASAEDRMAEARSLLSRVALGALSFAILLKAGSWVLDPAGGRAPLAESASRVASAKWFHPLAVSLVASLAATAVWLRRRYVKPTAESRSTDEPPTPPRERSLIRSG